LTRSDNIKDAVNSFVMSLEEEQKNEKIINTKAEKEEEAQNKKSDPVKLYETHDDGIERLADILKKTIEIITMDKEIRIEPDKEKSSIAVYGRDLSIVIGKNGRNMDALEYLINLIGKRKKLIEKNVVLDIGLSQK
jgi:predicted RNA-binding protein Jag